MRERPAQPDSGILGGRGLYTLPAGSVRGPESLAIPGSCAQALAPLRGASRAGAKAGGRGGKPPIDPVHRRLSISGERAHARGSGVVAYAGVAEEARRIGDERGVPRGGAAGDRGACVARFSEGDAPLSASSPEGLEGSDPLVRGGWWVQLDPWRPAVFARSGSDGPRSVVRLASLEPSRRRPAGLKPPCAGVPVLCRLVRLAALRDGSHPCASVEVAGPQGLRVPALGVPGGGPSWGPRGAVPRTGLAAKSSRV